MTLRRQQCRHLINIKLGAELGKGFEILRTHPRDIANRLCHEDVRLRLIPESVLKDLVSDWQAQNRPFRE